MHALRLTALVLCLITLPGCLRTPVSNLPGLDHTVVAGDHLTGLSLRYGVPVQVIADANGLSSARLVPGSILRIPGGRIAPPAPAPTPEPPAAPEPSETADGWYLPRSTWTEVAVVASRATPMGGTPVKITVHHSGDHTHEGREPLGWLRMVEDRHMAGHRTGAAVHQPWAAIGYHFLILEDGRILEGRPMRWQGAHVGGDANRKNIGICLVGDFDHERPAQVQINALVTALDRLRAAYRIPRSEVYGHRDFKGTNCPGTYLYPLLDDYRDNRLVAKALRPTDVLKR
jgi:hypothetical protein